MTTFFKILLTLAFVSLATASMDPTCFKLPNNKHPLECCNEPKLFPGETFAKCAAIYPPPPMPPPDGKLKGCCMSECVLNETKINVNGMPNAEKAITVIDEKMNKDPDFMPVVTTAIHECSASLKNYQSMFDEMMKNQVGDEKVCHPQSGFMIGCFYGNVFSNCPAKRWSSSPECDAIKQHVGRCHFLLPQLNK